MSPNKIGGSKICAYMHNYISCPNYLESFIKFGVIVSMDLCLQKCDRQTGKTVLTR